MSVKELLVGNKMRISDAIIIFPTCFSKPVMSIAHRMFNGDAGVFQARSFKTKKLRDFLCSSSIYVFDFSCQEVIPNFQS